MGVIDGFKRRQLEKYILKHRNISVETKSAKHFEAIKSIGIVLDGKHKGTCNFVDALQHSLESDGKKIEVMAYISKLKKDNTLPVPFFTKSDVNWLSKPIKKEVLDFMNQPFDLLINFSPDNILPLECICALSKAKFIIGNGTNHFNYYYDFLIKLNNSNAPESLMENVKHYLNLQR